MYTKVGYPALLSSMEEFHSALVGKLQLSGHVSSSSLTIVWFLDAEGGCCKATEENWSKMPVSPEETLVKMVYA